MKPLLLILVSGLCATRLLAQPTITNQPSGQVALAGGTVAFSVAASGVGPFTYQWQFRGTNLPASLITSVAGGGSGDGGAATNAIVYRPYAVAVDGAGNLFIVENGNNRIRKVDTNGVITTVAGTGTQGYSGDGGPATNAALSSPDSLALDSTGNLFITDYGNHRIRRIGTNGIITTVVGKGTSTYSGDGGAATNAGVPYPVDVAVDATGNLFISGYNNGYNNHRIRRVGTNGIITVVAGTGTGGYSGDGGAATNAMLNFPQGLTVDAAGNLFIAESKRIRKVGNNGIISTVAGNGTYGYSGDGGMATNAAISSPTRLAVDDKGNLLLADYDNYRVRRVGTNGIITTVAGNGTNGFTADGGVATNTTVPCMGVTAGSDGSFFVADNATARIRKVDASGIISTVAGNGSQNSTYAGNGCTALNARLNYPVAVTSDPVGNLFITDRSNLRVRLVGTNNIITTVAGNGLEGFTGDGGPATEAKLHEPGGVAANAAGHLLIADLGNYCIRKVTPDGIITTVAGRGSDTPYDGIVATNAQLDSPSSVTLDAAGSLIFSDYNTIRKLSTNGLLTRLAGTGYSGYAGDGGAATLAMLSSPSGVAVDLAGNVFIADTGNQRIRRVDTNGVIATVAGRGTYGYSGDGGAATNAQFYNPGGLAVNAEGDLFIADSLNHRIRKVDAQGIITTVAGNGTNGYVGDGGSAIQAKISMPAGIALDDAGNLFIADYGNHRIRKVSPFASLPTLTLNNVTTNQAGDYQVIVTGAGGSVTSSVATLTLGLGRLAIARDGTNILVSFPTQVGFSYIVQFKASLADTNWNQLATIPGNGSTGSVTDPATNAVRFYRLLLRSLVTADGHRGNDKPRLESAAGNRDRSRDVRCEGFAARHTADRLAWRR